jgi:hypothetical protein
MGFAFRVNRGMRIALTPRGLRAGIGPRMARVHIGSGPVGISTGVGPFTTWTSLNPGSAARKAGSPRLAEYEAALAEHESMLTIHRERFAPATAPVLAAAEPAGRAEIEERTYALYRERIRGVPWWRVRERKQIHLEAGDAVLREIEMEFQEATAEVARDQALADEWWQALQAGAPDVTIDALNDAFFDNVQEALCVDVADREAHIVLAMPDLDDVPERYAALTPTGRPTTRAYSKTDRNALHLHLILAHVAVTLREAFAVAPGIDRSRVVVVERLGEVAVVMAGVFDRSAVDRLDDDDAPMNLLDLGRDVVVNRVGRTAEVRPIDLADQPDLAEVTAMLVDVDHLS